MDPASGVPIRTQILTGLLLLLLTGVLKVVATVLEKRRPLRNIAGPPSPSFLIGNLHDVHQGDAGTCTLGWAKTYGGIVRWDGLLGDKCLMVSDPGAIRYILANHSSNFERAFYRRQQIRLTLGPALSASAGADHTRHRRVMQPALNPGPVKTMAPTFREYATRLCDAMAAKGAAKEPTVLDLHHWVELATMDAMFKAAFGVDVDSLSSSKPTEWSAIMSMTLSTSLWPPKPVEALIRNGVPRLPPWAAEIALHLPAKQNKAIQKMRVSCKRQATALVRERLAALDRGDATDLTDALSLMLKANAAENPRHRLSEAELAGQICNLLVAGHQTTAHSICWIAFELSRQPEMQSRLRDEVLAARKADADVTENAEALDALPYLNAVLKESSRYHPTVFSTGREAIAADVIPLSKPILARDGTTTLDSVAVGPGTGIELDIYSCNMSEDVWGADAAVFRPDRWLGKEGEVKRGVGLYSGLMNFINGPRACIGWRFSIVETQIMLFHLIERFHFAPAPGIEIGKAFNFFVNGYVKGQEDAGAQMPMLISAVPRL